jgi:hypothetical protein
MSAIFLSYRHDDSADVTGRIYDRLTYRFGRGNVVWDIDAVPLGVDFREFLAAAVGRCRVFLAIIGQHWLEASDDSGRRRLDDPDDFVRIEIETALRREIPVIPVLVQGSRIPECEKLPASLRELPYRNGIAIRHDPDFAKDVRRLAKNLHRLLGDVFMEQPAASAEGGSPCVTLHCPFCMTRFRVVPKAATGNGELRQCPACVGLSTHGIIVDFPAQTTAFSLFRLRPASSKIAERAHVWPGRTECHR